MSVPGRQGKVWQGVKHHLTNGTPARFQKMTIKPHLMEREHAFYDKGADKLFMVHVPCLRNAFFTFTAKWRSIVRSVNRGIDDVPGIQV